MKTRNPRFVVFGELHGTAEIPEFFADAACTLSGLGPLVVAVEFPDDDARVLDAFVQGAGAPQAAKVFASGIWTAQRRDGRSSEAMRHMFEQLRALHRSGRDIHVVGVVPEGLGSVAQDYYELAMADRFARAAGDHPASRVLVLVGNVHANKEPIARAGGLRPATSHLPTKDVVAFVNKGSTGSAWNCQADGCGPHSIGEGEVFARGVILYPAPQGGYDGYFGVGKPYSASPPAGPAKAIPSQ